MWRYLCSSPWYNHNTNYISQLHIYMLVFDVVLGFLGSKVIGCVSVYLEHFSWLEEGQIAHHANIVWICINRAGLHDTFYHELHKLSTFLLILRRSKTSILKRSCDFLIYTKKETVYYLSVNIWVHALGPCLLLLQSA